MTEYKPGTNSPIIYEYLKKYQDDPTSRIFAPLAEAYRRAGLLDEAIEIAREGLLVHPSFVGGRVALARALFDKKMYEEVVEELAPVARDVPDNLVAQRLLADSSLMLGRVTEALSYYKMLLFFAPNDTETAQLVQDLEQQAYSKGALVLRTDTPTNFQEKPLSEALAHSPEARQKKWILKVELLQSLLQKIERYRMVQAFQKPSIG